jgi:insulysin
MSNNNPIISSKSNILVPKNEKRVIKAGVLDNDLKYSIIKDDKSDSSYVAVGVNVGSEMDPDDYEGLAHFLEHMLFLGSKKFTGEKDFEEKVKINGGMTNAYTAGNITVYYLSVLNSGLEEILDMFSQFFISPLFNSDSVDREVNAVDSEHKKNIQNDLWRMQRFKGILANPEHPMNRFSTGSIETLRKNDIRNRMIEFYNEYYCSNNISISVSTNKSIEETEKIISKYFSKIKKKNTIKGKEIYLEKMRTISPIKEEQKGKWYQLIPIKDLKVLSYFWPIPSEIVNYQSKNWNIISYVLSNNSTDSLIDHLKLKGYIQTISVDIEDYLTFSIFTISIVCTTKGISNLNYINSLVKKYLDQLKTFDKWKIVSEDYKKISQTKYDYGSKESSMSLVQEFVDSMFNYPMNEIYSAPYLVTKLTSEEIPKLLNEYLDFDKSVKILISKNIISNNPLKKEKHYGLEYCELEPLMVDDKYNYPFKFIDKNNFIPDKIVHYNIEHQIPKKLNKSYESWLGTECRFDEPIINGIIQLYSPTLVNTPKNYLLTNLILNLIDIKLDSKLYLPSKCGYNFSVGLSSSKSSVILTVTGFNSNYTLFLNHILALFFKKKIFSKVLVETQLVEIMTGLENKNKYSPVQYANYQLNKDTFKTSYDNKILISKLKEITVKDVLNYYDNFLSEYSVLTFFYGNLDENNFKNKFTFFDKHKNIGFKSVGELISRRDIKVDHPNKEEKNSLIKFIFPIGGFDPKLYAIFTLFNMIFENDFYDFCRTKNQLGYLVNMNINRLGETYILQQTIQSTFPVEKVIEIMNQFNGNISSLLANISKDKLNKWKESLTNLYLEKDTDTSSVNSMYITEILRRTFLFDRHKILAKVVKDIQKSDLQEFYKTYLTKKNKKQFKLIVKGN